MARRPVWSNKGSHLDLVVGGFDFLCSPTITHLRAILVSGLVKVIPYQL